MGRFRLLGSRHQDRAGKNYVRGDIVESDGDLMRAFPERFEVVPKAVPKVVPKAVPKVVPKAVPKVVPKAVPKVVPKAVPKVAQAGAQKEEGEPPVSPSSRPEPVIPVSVPIPPHAEPTPADGQDHGQAAQRPAKAGKRRDKRGLRRTASFPLAMDADLGVFRRGKYYYVYDLGKDASAKPLNKTGMKRSEVDGFILDLE